LACVHPPNFDLPAYWVQAATDFIAAIPPPLKSHRRRYAKAEQIAPPDEKGWLTLAVLFDVEEVAAENVLSLSYYIEVIEPPELREKVLRLARATLELYQRETRGV
jgi:predicted DNA-binding transcriptional regulator YafY